MATYNEMVGLRLRSIRRQRGFSLQDVQRVSGGEFKAAVLGAYERGERSLSVPRLRRLSEFFDVPITQLLPVEKMAQASENLPTGGLTIDLNKVDQLTGPEAELLDRFLRGIQMQRQDFNGRVLTVRRDDLRMLGMLLGVTSGDLAGRLEPIRAVEPIE